MSTEQVFVAMMERVRSDLGHFIGAATVDIESGMTLAALSDRVDFDLSVASAYNSELVKQKLKIMRVLNIKGTLEDMILNISDQIHFIKLLPGGTSFLYLAAEREGTNLAIMRASIERNIAALR